MRICVLCVALLLILPGLASADLIVNPGFETGSFSGWTLTGNTSYTSVGSTRHSGSYGASLGPMGGLGYLSQTIATVAGAWYDANFWLNSTSTSTSPREFHFLWDGVAMLDLFNPPAIPWTQYTYHLQAIDSSTVVEFSFRNDPAWWFLDDADVTFAHSGVPEPTSFALIGLGLTGLALLGRKRRTR